MELEIGLFMTSMMLAEAVLAIGLSSKMWPGRLDQMPSCSFTSRVTSPPSARPLVSRMT
jgi:hypothetical protein